MAGNLISPWDENGFFQPPSSLDAVDPEIPYLPLADPVSRVTADVSGLGPMRTPMRRREDFPHVAFFALTQSGAVAITGALTTSGDLGYPLSFSLDQSGGVAVAGALGLTGGVFFGGGDVDRTGAQVSALGPMRTPLKWRVDFSRAAVPFDVVQSGQTALAGALSVAGDVAGVVIVDRSTADFSTVGPMRLPFRHRVNFIRDFVGFEIEAPLQVDLLGAIGVSGDLGYTVPAGVPFAFTQVGAFTVNGTLTVSGDIGFTLASPQAFDIAQVGAVAMTGVMQTLGNIQFRTTFALLTQPLGINGTLALLGDIAFPAVHYIVQLNTLDLTGEVGIAAFGGFEYPTFTEGLPAGWRIERFLEEVPNPNYGTAYGNNYFTRWTWKGFDADNVMVAASGSEDDCYAQTLSIAQSRYARWRELA
jgi:hypothetical protein